MVYTLTRLHKLHYYTDQTNASLIAHALSARENEWIPLTIGLVIIVSSPLYPNTTCMITYYHAPLHTHTHKYYYIHTHTVLVQRSVNAIGVPMATGYIAFAM
jgi:hypothetical protein